MAHSVRWTGAPNAGYLEDDNARRLKNDDLGLAVRDKLLGPSGAITETLPRGTTPLSNTASLASGTVRVDAVQLQEGDVVTSISYMSATTALSGGTVQLFGLYSKALARLAQSADDTNTAWGANTVKTLAMATPYTVPRDDYYYLAILVAGTVPTLAAITYTNAVASSTPPILSATSTTSATALPATAGALTAIATRAYAYIL